MKILIIVFVMLGGLFLVGGGYFLGLQNSQTSEPTQTPIPAIVPSPSAEPSILPIPSPSADTKIVLKQMFEEKNFDDLKPFLAPKVNIIAYGTECCGQTEDLDKVVDFVSGYGEKQEGWVFDPEDSKYADIDEAFDTFAISKDGKALGFLINENGKIEKAEFFVDYRLASN